MKFEEFEEKYRTLVQPFIVREHSSRLLSLQEAQIMSTWDGDPAPITGLQSFVGTWLLLHF